MSAVTFGRKLRQREHKSVDYLDKVRNAFLYEKAMDPNEFAKYGGKRANILLKAIDDNTPIETDSGTFPLTWIDNSDRDKLKTAIGGDKEKYAAVFKSGTRFKPILKNQDGKEFTVKQIVNIRLVQIVFTSIYTGYKSLVIFKTIWCSYEKISRSLN